MDGFARDDLDRRPSVIAMNPVDANEGLQTVVARRGKRKGVSAESFVPDANFRAPHFDHTSAEIQAIKLATANNMLFNALADRQREMIYNVMEKITVPSGTTLINEGDSGDYFYVVMSGAFEVYKAETADEPVYSYRGGGSFGELALMYNCPRAASVVASVDSIVFRLDRHTFRQLIVHTENTSASQHISKLRNKFQKRTQSICASQADRDEFHGRLRSVTRPSTTAHVHERLFKASTTSNDMRLGRPRTAGLPMMPKNANAKGVIRARISRDAKIMLRRNHEIDGMANMQMSGHKREVCGHVYRVDKLPDARAMNMYLFSDKLSGGPPLRIVSHNESGIVSQKKNPTHTHRGRIRNASGGFYYA